MLVLCKFIAIIPRIPESIRWNDAIYTIWVAKFFILLRIWHHFSFLLTISFLPNEETWFSLYPSFHSSVYFFDDPLFTFTKASVIIICLWTYWLYLFFFVRKYVENEFFLNNNVPFSQKKLIKDNAMDKKGAFGMHNKIKRTIRNLRIMYTLKKNKE